jgi:hypothetical protein
MRTFNYWPTILLFREADNWRCFVYDKQQFQYAVFHAHSGHQPSIDELQAFMVNGLQISMNRQPITLVGDFHPELAELCRSELGCQVITEIPSLAKGPSVQLPVTTQAMVVGLMEGLRGPQQALQAVDISLPKPRFCWFYFDFLKQILVKKWVFCALGVSAMGLLVANGVLFQQMQKMEVQQARLQQIQMQRQRLQAQCQSLQEENAARSFWPSIFLSVVQVLQAMEDHCCIDGLRTVTDKNRQPFLLLTGRVVNPAKGFCENLKARLMELQPSALRNRFSITMQPLTVNCNRFTVNMPVAVPKILQSILWAK